ncbi:MAG: alpha-galactosidase [Clostridiales bacterium]|nr:alpha-galactosidase [Clostridiales bacterium]
MERLEFCENGIHLVFEIYKGQLKLLHFSSKAFQEQDIVTKSKEGNFHLVEIEIAGLNRPYERFGNKYVVTAPGCHMSYIDHKDYRNEYGRKLEFITFDQVTGIQVTSHLQFYDGISVLRSWSQVQNLGSSMQTLTYISSFNYLGIEKEGLHSRSDKMKLKVCHNSWYREMLWREYTLEELGLLQTQDTRDQRSSKVVSFSNTGNWSTKEFLPMGYIENTEVGNSLFWQIEHNGSWHWEISDQTGHLYLALSGPTEIESHWFKNLEPLQSFTSVPVAVGVCTGSFDDSMGELTKYRRRIRRSNKDNEKLNVIFNDYMNCLWGNPTTQEELPLVDAASKAGCEYYVIDAGWYSDGDWWDSVGEWKESKKRFPNGLKEVTEYIKSKGMIPGVWLELEVMGINCPKVQRVPKNWFFIRHGKRVTERSRYQLDFRNPSVIEYANSIIDRLVRDYQIGYIKMDYNIEPGIGTELNTDSIGDGLLQHERAYLQWLDSVFKKYPNLVIENCSSGGLRMDYGMLSRYSIQSTSDQHDYRYYATMAANAPAALTPEQAGVWSYPVLDGDREEVVFNMINAMLLRIHQSGQLAKISEERRALVVEGIQVYKRIREDIPKALPFWPIGLSDYRDEYSCLGLKTEDRTYVAIWRREGKTEIVTLPIAHLKGKKLSMKCIYPSYDESTYVWNKDTGEMTVRLPRNNMARLFELTVNEK